MMSDETEWFLGNQVSPKKNAMPSGLELEEASEYGIESLWGQPGPITAGWHDKKDPETSLQFEVHGWFWYGHDLDPR